MNRFVKGLLLCSVLLTTGAKAATRYSFALATRQKLITYTISGVEEASIPKQNALFNTGHYGPCLKISIRNNSNAPIELAMPTGTTLFPDQAKYQQMIVTEDYSVELVAHGNTTDKIFAMCAQPFKLSPDIQAFYKVGELAEKKTVSVAKIIDDMDLQNGVGQELLWSTVDPTYLAKFRTDVNTDPPTAFIALALNKAGVISSKELLRYLPFRPDTIAISVTKRDTIHHSITMTDTVHNKVVMRDTAWEKSTINHMNYLADKKADEAKRQAESDLTTGFITGLSLLSVAAGISGFVIGRVSYKNKTKEMQEDDYNS
jgi:hypothetical protein